MEDFAFDIGGLLSEEEANKLFEEQVPEQEEEETKESEVENDRAEEEEKSQPSEKVGKEDYSETEKNAISSDEDGSSPNIYSSIANALKKDGIFPDFEDSELEAVTTPDAFAELFEKAVSSRLDERMKRIDAALGNGLAPEKVNMYEKTLDYLNSITEETITAEGEEGDNVRKQLIFNDLVKRGYSEEKALREVEKSFKAGDEVQDAKDALAALTKIYTEEYNKLQEDAKKEAENIRAAQKKQADDFKKMVLDDEVKLGDTVLDKKTCKRVYEAVSKPTYKDPETGKLLTEVQKFQKEKPLEFLKQLGMWFVLTDGGKDTEGFTKEQLRAEKNKSIKELAHKINSSSLNPDGSLKYVSGGSGDTDPLLSEGWKVGW